MKIEVATPTSKTAFYFMQGINRAIIPRHVTKIVNSIQKLGVIRPVVTLITTQIDGVRRRYILDGQHLFTALQRQNMNIPYVTVYSECMKEIVEWIACLNASSKSWVLMDYIMAWKALPEKHDYVTLYNSIVKNDLPPNLTSICYCVEDQRNISSIIKKGDFVVINKTKGDEILKHVSDIFGVVKGRHNNRAVIHDFVSTYVKWRYATSIYDHKKFLKYVKDNEEKFLMLMATPDQTNKILQKFGT